MNPTTLHTVAAILGPDIINQVHAIVRSEPVSFAALKRNYFRDDVKECFEQNFSNHKTAGRLRVHVRTIQRHKRAYLRGGK